MPEWQHLVRSHQHVAWLQYIAQVAALSSSIDDAVMELDRIDTDRTAHAGLIGTHRDQVSDSAEL